MVIGLGGGWRLFSMEDDVQNLMKVNCLSDLFHEYLLLLLLLLLLDIHGFELNKLVQEQKLLWLRTGNNN